MANYHHAICVTQTPVGFHRLTGLVIEHLGRDARRTTTPDVEGPSMTDTEREQRCVGRAGCSMLTGYGFTCRH